MNARSLTAWQRVVMCAAAVFVAVLVIINLRGPGGGPGAEVEASAAGAGGGSPRIGGCPVFPANNVWNTPVDTLPVDSHSAAYLASMDAAAHGLHPDFGSNPANGIPYAVVKAGVKRVPVNFEYRDDSDLSNYPIPANAPIEGGSSGTGDRHVLLVEPVRCLLFELYDATPQPDGSWKAGSGIIMDLTSNALRADGKTSADAAGLPILPGLVRYDEVKAGEIDHALRFTVPKTQAAHIWPARHDASHIHDANYPPMGVRLRLKADFDISGFSPENRVILRALKKYGMILADNGGPFFLSGAPDARWNDDDLHHLTEIKGSDFEVVDESGWQMMENSGRVDPLALPPNERKNGCDCR